jgi:hypothetical protein
LLHRRIELFLNLPIASLDKKKLRRRLDEIGQTQSVSHGEGMKS